MLGNEMQWQWVPADGRVVGAKSPTPDVIGAVDLYLFDRSVTFGTDNVVPSISDADVLFYLGKISFPAPDDLRGCRWRRSTRSGRRQGQRVGNPTGGW